MVTIMNIIQTKYQQTFLTLSRTVTGDCISKLGTMSTVMGARMVKGKKEKLTCDFSSNPYESTKLFGYKYNQYLREEEKLKSGCL